MERAEERELENEHRNPFRLILLYQVVLRPLRFVCIAAGCISIVLGRWGLGGWLLAMAGVFTMQWKWLQEQIVNEAYVGPLLPLDDEEDPIDAPEGVGRMSQEEAEILCAAFSILGWLIGVTTAVVLRLYVSNLYVLIPVGILAAFIWGRLVGYMFTIYSVWFEGELIEYLEDREDS